MQARFEVHSQLLFVALAVNLIVAPALGLALIWGRPAALVSVDLLGVPALAYALIFTWVPVIVLTCIGHLVFLLLGRAMTSCSFGIWHLTGAFVGAIAGLAAAGWFMRAADQLWLGATVGLVCGAAQAQVWWRSTSR